MCNGSAQRGAEEASEKRSSSHAQKKAKVEVPAREVDSDKSVYEAEKSGLPGFMELSESWERERS